jgi:hypothetical protein
MTPIATAGHRAPTTLDYGQWLGRFAIASEKVDGRWQHELYTGGPAWEAHLARVETRTNAG